MISLKIILFRLSRGLGDWFWLDLVHLELPAGAHHLDGLHRLLEQCEARALLRLLPVPDVLCLEIGDVSAQLSGVREVVAGQHVLKGDQRIVFKTAKRKIEEDCGCILCQGQHHVRDHLWNVDLLSTYWNLFLIRERTRRSVC